MAGFVIRAGNSTDALALFDKPLKLREMKIIAKMGILNYKYLHKFVAVYVSSARQPFW